MDIRIEGSANFSRVQQQLAGLRAQVAALNTELARTGVASAGVNPAGYRQMQTAMRASSQTFRDAAASSGTFLTQQVRLNSATEEMTNRINKQKVGLREMVRERGRLTEVYREQARLQSMYVREAPSMGGRGRGAYDIAVPRMVSAELNTINSRLTFTNALIRSASTQMVNWGKNTQWAGRQLMVGFTYPMMLFGAAAGALAYQVDKEMTRIMKVYDTTAKAVEGNNASMMEVERELEEVRKSSWRTAEQASSAYGAAAKDTLALQAELAATGLKGSALQTSTNEAMRIATLGELEYQQAADTTIALQTAFKLSTQELTDAFNFMNATENATSLSIQDIAEATPRAASAMSALGVSVEEMTVLLVSMREAGVDAAEGANALKSATGTILAPSPAADKFIKQISDGNVQVTELAEKSGGNLYTALQLLSKEMNGLDQVAKQQILVKLFGKYQFNRVSAMLYNLSDAVNGVGNQTKTAMDLMGNSTAENAQTAERELKRFQTSVSGRFKIALENVKNTLTTMGEPFLEIAIWTMKAANGIGKFFNSLPGGVKKTLAIAAVLAALIGPVTMLVGLFANFFGTIVKGLAWFAGLGRAAGLVTKESKAMELASRSAAAGWDRQTTAVQQLTRELGILTAAQIASQRSAAGLPLYGANGKVLSSTPSATYTGSTPRGAGAVPWSAPTGTSAVGMPSANVTAQQASFMAMYGQQLQNNLQVQQDTTRAAAATAEQQKRTRKFLAGSAASAGVMGAAMATMAISGNETVDKYAMLALTAALVVPLLTTAVGAMKQLVVNSVAAHKARKIELAEQRALTAATAQTTVAQRALNGAVLQGAGSARATAVALGMVTAASTAAAAGTGAVAANAATATSRFGRMRGAVGAVGRGVAVLGRGMGAIMGPVGWIITGLVTVGALLYMQNKKMKEQIKAQADEMRAVNQNASSWAATMNKVAGSYNTIAAVNPQLTSPSNFDTTVDKYRDGETAEGKTADNFKELDNDAEKARRALMLFIDLQKEGGLTAKEAAGNISALYYATGSSMAEANRAGMQLANTYQSLDRIDWDTALVAAQEDFMSDFPELMNSIGQDRGLGGDAVWQAGSRYGKLFGQAFSEAQEPDEAMKVYQNLEDTALKGWSGLYETMQKEQSDWLSNRDITNIREFSDYVISQNMKISGTLEEGLTNSQMDTYNILAADAQEYSSSLINATASAAGLGDGIWTLAQFQADLNVRARMLSYKEKTAEIQEMIVKQKELNSLTGTRDGQGLDGEFIASTIRDTSTAMNRARVESYGLAKGLTLSEGQIDMVLNGTLDLATALKFARIDAREVGNELARIGGPNGGITNPFGLVTMKDSKEILQNATKEMQEEMAANAMENFENRMQASLDQLQKYWDQRSEQLEVAQQRDSERQEDRHERQDEKFEDRWEIRTQRVEDYWDARGAKVQDAIEAEQKAEDIRQRIFEAEMTRLDRLNAAANRNIDFNVALNAGNFDEAAKIRNDAQAAFADYALQDAAAASGTNSDTRVSRLEGQSERIDKRKEESIKALEDLEEAERKSLDKRQEQEKKHLAKLQDIQKKDLAARAEASMDSRREDWELDKVAYNQRVELFKAYQGRSIEEILKWADKVGIEYEDFGDKRLKPMGQDWAVHFKDQLVKKIRKAGAEVASSKVWEQMANDEAKAILAGFGFDNIRGLRKFIKTGVMPKRNQTYRGNEDGNRDMSMGGGNDTRIAHTGGEVGSGINSRKGVARTQKGIHSSERLLLARKKEFVVNEKSYAANKSLIQNINNARGPVDASVMPRGVMGGAGLGSAGLIGAISYAMMSAGVKAGMTAGIQKAKSNQAASASGSMFSAGKAGIYGDLELSLEQLNNAKTIANVGRNMGMSARDIQIGIMTAITESMLKNVNFGDRDSLGLFQQRPSQGWGTEAQVTDPEYAARKFFEGLKGIGDRENMAPWQAAQAVQRSAFADGSNYQIYWDEANAIYKRGLRVATNGLLEHYGPGPGGRHRPTRGGSYGPIHDTATAFPGVDLALPIGTPVYAVGDGVITKSYDIRGYEGRRMVRGQTGSAVQDGYRSYGRVMEHKLDAGPTVLYAHLSQRGPLGRVSGGSKIGAVGNTGYVLSSRGDGSHLHFGSSDGNPLQFLAKGGTTKGEGLAYLHDQETILSKPLSRELQDAVKALGAAGRNMLKGRATTAAQPFPGFGGKKKRKSRFSVNTFGASDPENGSLMSAMAASYLNNNVGSMFDTSWFTQARGKKNNIDTDNINSTNNKAGLKIGTLNTWVKASAKATVSDLMKLIPGTDFLALTEMGSKYRQVGKWLGKQGWGYLGGPGRERGHSIMAYNKATQKLDRKGQQKLGDKKADVIGGRELRYANYGLFTDKKSGRKTWQVAAHTVPAGRGLNAKNGPLYKEQWANLNRLVGELQGTGQPVFVSGDLNVHKGRSNFQTPGTLDEFASRGVDYVFGDKRYAKLLGQRGINGMNTDHGGALMSNFSIPGFKKGGFMTSEGLAYLHDDEAVTSKPLTQNLIDGAKNFASGAGNTYNLTVNANGNYDTRELATVVVKEIQRMDARQPRSRKGGN